MEPVRVLLVLPLLLLQPQLVLQQLEEGLGLLIVREVIKSPLDSSTRRGLLSPRWKIYYYKRNCLSFLPFEKFTRFSL